MERDYADEIENIYFRCRKEAARNNERLCSREGAAELLGVSPSTLANYELGITKTVPPDAVVMMADLYHTPELKCHYCANDCPIGKGSPIATKISSIELITVKVIKALSQNDAEEAKSRLLDIVDTSFDYRGERYQIYIHYENYRGGVNNLCVANVIKDGGIWCGAGIMAAPITIGTSEHGKERAIRNAMRNFRRLGAEINGARRLVRETLRRL